MGKRKYRAEEFCSKNSDIGRKNVGKTPSSHFNSSSRVEYSDYDQGSVYSAGYDEPHSPESHGH